MTDTTATTAPAEIAASLSPAGRDFLLWATRNARGREPAWMRPDSDPTPMIEARRAGCVKSDVYAIMPTPLGRAVAAELTCRGTPLGEADR